MDAVSFGFWSVLPPLIAIVLALITKEVFSSLLIGILSGALIFTGGNVLGSVELTFGIMVEKMGDSWNANILLFLALLGILVVLVTKAGGSRAYGEWAAKRIKSRTGASLATSVLGVVIFIDDYFNCLTVGTVMSPVTDKFKISRAKLAYLLDATAAPICIIAPVSSWAASIISQIESSGLENPMSVFINTIPYNLYAILTIIMIVVICVLKLDFGPMARFERVAQQTGDVYAGNKTAVSTVEGLKVSPKGKVYDLLIPIIALIVATVAAMLYTGGWTAFGGEESFVNAFGNTDAALSLVLGGVFALIVAVVLYLPRKVITFREFADSIIEGIKSMVPAITILILAWSISGICRDYLMTGDYVGDLVVSSNFPVMMLPAVIFIVAGLLAFATGTSWGTFGILIPIVVGIINRTGADGLMVAVISATLAGAVFGDHCSPISDTTILSSTGAGCNHIDHVSTQLVYASTVAACCFIGYILVGLLSIWVALPISIVLLVGALFLLHKYYTPKVKQRA